MNPPITVKDVNNGAPRNVAALPAAHPGLGVKEKDGRRRPHYWDCGIDGALHLRKTLSQPWFQAFAGPLRNPLPSFLVHREGLIAAGLVRVDVHDRRPPVRSRGRFQSAGVLERPARCCDVR